MTGLADHIVVAFVIVAGVGLCLPEVDAQTLQSTRDTTPQLTESASNITSKTKQATSSDGCSNMHSKRMAAHSRGIRVYLGMSPDNRHEYVSSFQWSSQLMASKTTDQILHKISNYDPLKTERTIRNMVNLFKDNDLQKEIIMTAVKAVKNSESSMSIRNIKSFVQRAEVVSQIHSMFPHVQGAFLCGYVPVSNYFVATSDVDAQQDGSKLVSAGVPFLPVLSRPNLDDGMALTWKMPRHPRIFEHCHEGCNIECYGELHGEIVAVDTILPLAELSSDADRAVHLQNLVTAVEIIHSSEAADNMKRNIMADPGAHPEGFAFSDVPPSLTQGVPLTAPKGSPWFQSIEPNSILSLDQIPTDEFGNSNVIVMPTAPHLDSEAWKNLLAHLPGKPIILDTPVPADPIILDNTLATADSHRMSLCTIPGPNTKQLPAQLSVAFFQNAKPALVVPRYAENYFESPQRLDVSALISGPKALVRYEQAGLPVLAKQNDATFRPVSGLDSSACPSPFSSLSASANSFLNINTPSYSHASNLNVTLPIQSSIVPSPGVIGLSLQEQSCGQDQSPMNQNHQHMEMQQHLQQQVQERLFFDQQQQLHPFHDYQTLQSQQQRFIGNRPGLDRAQQELFAQHQLFQQYNASTFHQQPIGNTSGQLEQLTLMYSHVQPLQQQPFIKQQMPSKSLDGSPLFNVNAEGKISKALQRRSFDPIAFHETTDQMHKIAFGWVEFARGWSKRVKGEVTTTVAIENHIFSAQNHILTMYTELWHACYVDQYACANISSFRCSLADHKSKLIAFCGKQYDLLIPIVRTMVANAGSTAVSITAPTSRPI